MISVEISTMASAASEAWKIDCLGGLLRYLIFRVLYCLLVFVRSGTGRKDYVTQNLSQALMSTFFKYFVGVLERKAISVDFQ